MTSGKFLLNVPEPWFPHLKRGVGGHKRSFERQNTLVPKDGEFLQWHGTCSEASLVPGSMLSLPLLCTRASPFLFRVQGGIKCSSVVGLRAERM